MGSMGTRKTVNRYVELIIGQFGRCRFIADLGRREFRTSMVYASETDAMKDYHGGHIRWNKEKHKKGRFD